MMVALGLFRVTVALGQGSLRAPPSSNLLGQVCLSPPEWTKGEASKQHQPNTGPLVMAQRGGEMEMYHCLIGDPSHLLILPAPRLRSVLPWRRHLSMGVTNFSSRSRAAVSPCMGWLSLWEHASESHLRVPGPHPSPTPQSRLPSHLSHLIQSPSLPRGGCFFIFEIKAE